MFERLICKRLEQSLEDEGCSGTSQSVV
jgi:hypothetical protein